MSPNFQEVVIFTPSRTFSARNYEKGDPIVHKKCTTRCSALHRVVHFDNAQLSFNPITLY